MFYDVMMLNKDCVMIKCMYVFKMNGIGGDVLLNLCYCVKWVFEFASKGFWNFAFTSFERDG